MSLVVKKMRGINLYARDAVRPRWYPSPSAPAAYVEVWAVDTDKPTTFEHARLIGKFAPGQQDVPIDFNPAVDRYKELRAVTYSASGVPNVRYLEDAPAVTVLFSRVSSAPTLAQVGASEETQIQIEVTGFDVSLVKARQVQIADDSAFTVNKSESTSTGVPAISTSIFIGGVASSTRYVRVRHSSAGSSGPWSAWSTALMITFADPGGTGGTSGSGNGYGGGEY